MINSLDLAELLEEEGYALDQDTGEVYTDPESKRDLLITLACLGKLNVKRDAEFQLGFYIPNWTCFSFPNSPCREYPHEQQCKCYDV
tara:strand:+ start:94 stop:354 length:261 start_codon:yes stop_codon:yes gene_type:complete